ncbi:MAG TPA: peptidylprolyl isomerase [Opitutaceae bacterium]|nr:peptidylprolyl isomerase [Opitutaceae bacterium]
MSSSRYAVGSLVAVLVTLAAPAGIATEQLADGLYAVIHTPKGVITAELFPDKAPLTVASFVGLAEGTIAFQGRSAGQPFYDGLVFHRVVPGFVIQGGDPLGSGEGGPGYSFADEFDPRARHVRGALAMANSGPNTNGSQFYFAIEPVHRLNYKHTVFGVVHSGMDVVTAIAEGDSIERVEIMRVGEGAQAYHPAQESFDALLAAARVLQPRHTALPPLYSSEVDLGVPEWFPRWIEEKLNHYHQVRGTQIFVRLGCSISELPGGLDKSLSNLLASLSLGDPHSCLLIYFDEEKSWRVWFGDAAVPFIVGDGTDIDSESGKKNLHAAKTTVLAPAKLEIELGKPRRSIDAAVTSLIETLDAKRTGSN